MLLQQLTKQFILMATSKTIYNRTGNSYHVYGVHQNREVGVFLEALDHRGTQTPPCTFYKHLRPVHSQQLHPLQLPQTPEQHLEEARQHTCPSQHTRSRKHVTTVSPAQFKALYTLHGCKSQCVSHLQAVPAQDRPDVCRYRVDQSLCLLEQWKTLLTGLWDLHRRDNCCQCPSEPFHLFCILLY